MDGARDAQVAVERPGRGGGDRPAEDLPVAEGPGQGHGREEQDHHEPVAPAPDALGRAGDQERQDRDEQAQLRPQEIPQAEAGPHGGSVRDPIGAALAQNHRKMASRNDAGHSVSRWAHGRRGRSRTPPSIPGPAPCRAEPAGCREGQEHAPRRAQDALEEHDQGRGPAEGLVDPGEEERVAGHPRRALAQGVL